MTRYHLAFPAALIFLQIRFYRHIIAGHFRFLSAINNCISLLFDKIQRYSCM